MKYFYDAEFIEGTQSKSFLGIKYGITKPTIDIISIGIISEDNREYYAISKDFNLQEAWNRYDVKEANTSANHTMNDIQVYWIRTNVLEPIYSELLFKENIYANQALHRANVYIPETKYNFTYNNLKKLINKYGKHNEEIAEEIKEFTYQSTHEIQTGYKPESIELYGYYSAYDHVALCWLFGKMIDLPKGFPMFTKDLKQMLDEKQEYYIQNKIPTMKMTKDIDILPNLVEQTKLSSLKNLSSYPKQENEHNSLDDAKFNKKLYNFLKQI